MKEGKRNVLLAFWMAALVIISALPLALADEADGLELDSEMEAELALYEEASDEDEQDLLEELSLDAETDEDEIADKIKMPRQEKEKYMQASQDIGDKQYIYNMQLQNRLRAANISTQAIIKHVEKKGINSTQLVQIQAQLAVAAETVVPENMTREQFQARILEIRNLTREFKETVHDLVPEDELDEIQAEIDLEMEKPENKEKQRAMEQKEKKARDLYNTKQVNTAFENLNKEAVAMRQGNQKLLGLAERLEQMHQLKEQYLGQQASQQDASEFREQWMQMLESYKAEKTEARLMNERAQLAHDAKDIIQAIRQAKQDGLDTTELESQLETIKSGIKSLNSGNVKDNEIAAKAAVLRTQLRNLEQDQTIKENVRQARSVRENIRQGPDRDGSGDSNKGQSRSTTAGNSGDDDEAGDDNGTGDSDDPDNLDDAGDGADSSDDTGDDTGEDDAQDADASDADGNGPDDDNGSSGSGSSQPDDAGSADANRGASR